MSQLNNLTTQINRSATSPDQRRKTGVAYEQLASAYLQEFGLQPIASNYQCRLGEIDLIMREQNTLVFVEVRYRLRSEFMSPIVSINKKKQQKLRRTAQVYLKHHGLTDAVPCRIDLIGITRCKQTGVLMYEWIKNAIESHN
ncbi:YraN family protein [Gammaproteobacteria bacterium LSUCC0112]|nr:YraN family protein [Gammaproteobacteria bacterium LSUCC0112]